MKNVLKILVTVCLVLLIASCGKKDDKGGTGGVAVDKLKSVAVGNDKIFLRYKFEKGDKFQLRFNTNSSSLEMIQADSNMTNKMFQSLTYVFDCEVLDVDQDSIAELSLMVSNIKVNFDLNGKKVTYTSGSKIAEQDKPKYMEYESIYNIPYRARVNSRGEVVEVSRVEKMIDKLNSLSPQKMQLSTEQRAGYAKQLAESSIRPMTQQIFRELPGDAIKKNFSWEKRFPQNIASLSMENVAKYTVVDFVEVDGNKAAKITADLSANISGNKKGTENGVNYTFGDPKISGDGTIVFDFESGKLIKAEVSTKTDLSISIEAKDSLGKMKKTKRTTSTQTKNIVEFI